MSYLKFSTNLFLEKQELNRLKRFLDDDGFRKLFLANSKRFGLINRQYFLQPNTTSQTLENDFGDNALIQEDVGLTLKWNNIFAVDSNGNCLVLDANGQLAVPADSNWYWVKIKYQTVNLEKGLVSIDTQGNMIGVNTKFTEVLRGQPNFPARIKLIGAVSNTLEYDVLEVISDTNAVLENSTFAAESNLQYIIVGTFTPNAVPSAAEKYIFNYDDCEITLVQETIANTRPSYNDGTEFFLARVKNDGATLLIQDKRIDIYRSKDGFDLRDITTFENPLFGIEKISYDDRKTSRQFNLINCGFTFRSTNYTVNTNLNILTIISGTGGKFKTTDYFSDGDFNGWRVYTKDGTFSIIKSSIKNGSQINCYLDILDVDRYSTDGGTTINSDQILITPNAEEIEIICKARESSDESDSHIGEAQLSDQRFVFAINTDIAKFKLLTYEDPKSYYEITYRFKHVDIYGYEYNMQPDTIYGYFTEKSFDNTGNYLPITQANSYAQNLAGGYIRTYVGNVIELTSYADAYGNDWIQYTVTNNDLATGANGNNWYKFQGSQSSDRECIRYKIIGRTCFLDFIIVSSNTNSTPVGLFKLKLPNGIIAKHHFTSAGWFENTGPTIDAQSSNQSAPGTLSNGATLLRVRTNVFFVQQGDCVVITPMRSNYDNFDTGGGSNNLDIIGSITFEIE